MTRQRGFTMIGLILIMTLVAMAALVGFKIVPVYIDYYTIRHSLENVLEMEGPQGNEALRKSFAARLNVNPIYGLEVSDLEIEREDGYITLRFPINRKEHLVGGISVSVDLEATASAKQTN